MSVSDVSSLAVALLAVACLIYVFAHWAAGVPIYYP